MLVDELADAETLRRELRTLRRSIAHMTNRRLFDEVDTLLSVAQHQTEQIITRLGQIRP